MSEDLIRLFDASLNAAIHRTHAVHDFVGSAWNSEIPEARAESNSSRFYPVVGNRDTKFCAASAQPSRLQPARRTRPLFWTLYRPPLPRSA